MINIEDFAKLDLRVGKILEVFDHPEADRLYVLKVSIGDKDIQILAGIKNYYGKDSLLGKEIIVITNLEPRKIRGLESQGMLLAAKDANGVFVLTPDKEVEPGSRVG
ncbi:MAG: methionine--tRNA ligase subunit beta [Candidatus Omnitrophota bacterium]